MTFSEVYIVRAFFSSRVTSLFLKYSSYFTLVILLSRFVSNLFFTVFLRMLGFLTSTDFLREELDRNWGFDEDMDSDYLG